MSKQPQQPMQSDRLDIDSAVNTALTQLKQQIETNASDWQKNFVSKITSLITRGLTLDLFRETANSFLQMLIQTWQHGHVVTYDDRIPLVIDNIISIWSSLEQASRMSGQEATYIPRQRELVTISGVKDKLNAAPIRMALEEYCSRYYQKVIVMNENIKFRVVAEGTLGYDTSITIGRVDKNQNLSRIDILDAPNQLSRNALQIISSPNRRISLVRKFSAEDTRLLNNGNEEGIKVYNIGPGYFLVFNWTTKYYTVVTSFEEMDKSFSENGGGNNIVQIGDYWFYTQNGKTYRSPVMPEATNES